MSAILDKTAEPVDDTGDLNVDEAITSPAHHDGDNNDGEDHGVVVADVDQDSSGSSVEAAGEDEWYTVIWVPPGSLIIGPNVRQENATPDKEGVRDIKKRGVRAPILAYRDESGDLVVTMGQMRTLQAIEAGREMVPVWVQPPPSEDEKSATIDRIIDQLGENDHRTPMTRGDVYRAHQQLRLLGLSATAIARRRSRSKRAIVDSLRVGESELAAKAADKYDLTLEQAAVIAEFESYGDLETAKELILTAVEKPTNFAVLAQRKRDDRAEAERLQQSETALVEQLTAAGVMIFDESISTWSGDARSLDRLRPTPGHDPGTELTADAHAHCSGHGAWIGYDYDDNDDRIAVPVYGCADFRALGHALLHAPAGRVEHGAGSTATFDTASSEANDGEGDIASAVARAALEREKARIERRWVRENNKDWDAAVKVRHKFLANLARRSSAPKTARKWLAQQKLNGSHALRKAMERHHGLAHRLLKLPEPGYGQRSELITKIANATEAKATVWDMYLTLAAMEESLQRDSWRRPMGTDSEYMSMLLDLGYEPHDVERKVITPERIEDVIAAHLPHHATPHTHENTHEDNHDDLAVGEPDSGHPDADPAGRHVGRLRQRLGVAVVGMRATRGPAHRRRPRSRTARPPAPVRRRRAPARRPHDRVAPVRTSRAGRLHPPLPLPDRLAARRLPCHTCGSRACRCGRRARHPVRAARAVPRPSAFHRPVRRTAPPAATRGWCAGANWVARDASGRVPLTEALYQHAAHRAGITLLLLHRIPSTDPDFPAVWTYVGRTATA